MREQYLKIDEVPALLLGEPSERVFLFVHGQGGSKEEARAFAEIACPAGWQVLGVDLPEHGVRVGSEATFDPWHAVPELKQVIRYARDGWRSVALRATSVGCWFSLLAFAGEPPARCLLVSPLLDMERMIQNLMCWSGVTEERLQREKTIPTNFGQTLSWDYLCYVREHPITSWPAPTRVFRAERDELIDRDTITAFCQRFGCQLTVMPGGEHWLHTPEELAALRLWEEEGVR